MATVVTLGGQSYNIWWFKIHNFKRYKYGNCDIVWPTYNKDLSHKSRIPLIFKVWSGTNLDIRDNATGSIGAFF